MTSLERQAAEYVDTHKDILFSLLSKLLTFDTQNFITYGREKECQSYIADLYREIDLETDIYSPDSVPHIKDHPGYLPNRGMEDRPNVTGICYGADPNHHVMIAAHTDTVQVGDYSKWTIDPFGGIMKGGRIYGLGAGDNKFGIAGSYFALKALKESGIKLKKTVLLTAYTDEEYGGGGGALAACLKYPCDTYVNMDGGNYEIWICALGGGVFEVEIKADFTTDTGSPTVDMLHYIKSELEIMGQLRREELHKNVHYTDSDMERSAFRLLEFSCGNFGVNLDSGKLKFAIYTDKTKEQIYDELNSIALKIRAVLNKSGFTTTGFKPITRFFTYAEANKDDLAIDIMSKAAEETSGRFVKQCGACLSDLSVFLEYGSKSSFSFGLLRDFSLPGGAHQPDEYIECKQFIEHTKALILFLIRYCGVI